MFHLFNQQRQTLSGNAGGALRSPPKGEVESLADCRQTASV